MIWCDAPQSIFEKIWPGPWVRRRDYNWRRLFKWFVLFEGRVSIWCGNQCHSWVCLERTACEKG